jgi:hypothetical protein
MNKTLEIKLRDFATKYKFKIKNENWQGIQEGQRHEIEEGLVSLFEGHGKTAYAETGTEPCEYLPGLVKSILQLLGITEWLLEEVGSEDEWETAKVTLNHSSGERYQFIVAGVDGSDWVPSDLFIKMQNFSKAKCEKTLMTFFSDDPYLMLALPHEAAIELGTIIDEYAEPYV